MGSVKDVYEILADIVDRVTGGKRKKRLTLSEYLGAIAVLMDDACNEFSARRVPHRESRQMLVLINHADAFATDFKDELRGLREIFDDCLPRIGELMKDADFFIDDKPRLRLHASMDTDDPNFGLLGQQAISKACNEMNRVAGLLEAYSVSLRINS